MQIIRCWSRIITAHGEPNHIQIGYKTACGITIGVYWDFEADDDLDQINCSRCRKAKIFKELEEAGPVEYKKGKEDDKS